MEEILPIEPYLRQARMPRVSLFLFVGALLGFLVEALIVTAPQFDPNRPLPDEPLVPLLWAIGGGAVYALLFRVVIGIRMRRLVVATYEQGWAFATPVPQEGIFTHRLCCIFVPQAGRKGGGSLFAGPGKLAFVPHRITLAATRETQWFPVSSGLEIVPGLVPAAGWKKFLGAADQPTLEIRGGGAAWLLWVPDAATAAPKLQAVVAPERRRGWG